MAPVRIVDTSYVAVPAAAALPPQPIKLNAMEAQWVVIPVLQRLLFFEGDQLPPFGTIIQSLKSSLAATLATHGPLAGKLVYLADTGDVAISCSTSDGVKFVIAESDADAHRLAGDEECDLQTFEQLVPEVDMSVLPASVLAVQATRLEGGGVAVGITVHHAVADGRSLWSFVEAWAAACRGDNPPAPPTFDRSLVTLPDGEELARSILRKYAPNLPLTRLQGLIVEDEDRVRFIRRTFTLDAQQIQRLKQCIGRLSDVPAASARPLSRFVAVVALAWTCSARSRPFPDDEDVFVFFPADVRGRLDPPVCAEYFGACLTLRQARLPARVLRGDGALVAAALAVQGAVRKMEEDPLDGWEFLSQADKFATSRFMLVSGSSSFRAYEAADFGWGRPRRTEQVRMNHDGQVSLVRSRDGEGIQVSVAMVQRAHMDAFNSEFLKIIG